jgi:DNA topoisomerase-2
MTSTSASKTIPAASTASAKGVAEAYLKLTQREHILVRPDSYVGSLESHKESRWIFDRTMSQMAWRSVDFNPGLFKIFDEVIVNAIDHVTRTATKAIGSGVGRVTKIRVTITPTSFSVWNDGEGIPVIMHPEYKIMIPELIFAHLLTSSNYDDKEEKVVGGKNGYGAKLTNIFSRTFTIRTADAGAKMIYEQVCSDNMATIGKPSFKPLKATAPYTEITSVPDLARFFGSGVTAIPDDMLDVLRTRVIDAAALVAGAGVTVSLDDKVVPVKSFESYVRLFLDGGKVPVFYERAGPRWEVAAVLTRHLHTDAADGVPDDRHISFVNGIFTRRGGKHVDAVCRAVLGSFCDGPGKKLDLKPAQLKDALTFFVNATIVNPSFDSQSKETLTTPVAKFGSVFKISEAFVTRLAKEGGLLEEAQAVLDARLSREAKKSDGRKASTVRGIPKLEDALEAGRARSGECTLILTEGDSAASMAIAGLAELGREFYGVFPLRGKVLNVRDATIKEKTDNKELTHLKRILGLEHGRKYKDVKTLRYGRVMIMTDQDVDGSHIKGLLINLFHAEWPELLDMGFLCSLMTPLLKATKGSSTRSFYSATEYEKWLEGEGAASGWHVKYYKGLGTSTAAEAREYFRDMTLVSFRWDETAGESIDMAFNEKRSDDRKEWLNTYSRERVLDIPTGGADVTFTHFINDELIHFSIADNLRSIPHVMDGLKPSQRKILWAARKRNLTAEMKVAQLAGYVSEHAAYHHGEVSLTEAIIGMAQNFVGSNNIHLLSPNGQFGTRLEGGKDSAAARYIFTALSPIQGALLSKADDEGLSWLEDDGQRVEPEYYMPVIPMLLVNGADGIGTGYSSKVLNYAPRDIVAALQSRLRETVTDLTGTVLTPWFDGFRGPIIISPDGRKVTTKGIYQFFDDEGCRVRITELPVGVWTKKYKAFLEKMLEEEVAAAPKAKGAKTDKDSDSVAASVTAGVKVLKSFQEGYTEETVEFTLCLEPEYYHEARTFPAEFEKKFKLTTSTTLSNMVAFDTEGLLRRFGSVGSILEMFYGRRLAGYATRKENELARLDAEIVELDAQVRFIRAVIAGTLVIGNAADEAILAGLKALDLPALSGNAETLDGYNYLLGISLKRLKATEVARLEEKLAVTKVERDTLAAKRPQDLWLTDLDIFSAAYDAFYAANDARRSASTASALGSKTKGKAKGKAVKKAPIAKKVAQGSVVSLVA